MEALFFISLASLKMVWLGTLFTK